MHARDEVWLIYAVTFLYGVAGSITSSAWNALKVQIVPEDLLVDVNGLQQSVTQALRLASPLVGVGLLAALGAAAVVWVDMATFLLGVACTCFMRFSEEMPEPSSGRWASEMAVGFRFLASDSVLRRLVLAFALALLGVGMFESVGFQVVTVGLHHTATWLGFLTTAQGVGGAIGGVCAARVATRLGGDRALVVCGLGVSVLACLALAVPQNAAVLIGAAIFGIAFVWASVGEITIFQKVIPNAMMGRVLGAASLATTLPQSVGISLGAILVSHIYYRDLCYPISLLVVMSVFCIGGPGFRVSSRAADPQELSESQAQTPVPQPPVMLESAPGADPA